MRVLAVIGARGGSKRLPDKNLRPLGGKPLINWSIDLARAIPEICDTLVSTDSDDIAAVSRSAGALVPWLRPQALASDEASSVDVCLHALDWYTKEAGAVDGMLLLQPTSPFRRRTSVVRGVELFEKNGRLPVVGVSPAASHPLWCFRLDGGRLQPFVAGGGLHLRSQDLPPAYAVNGAFYLVTPDHLRKQRSFFDASLVPLLMQAPGEQIDIDEPSDWLVAEALLASGELTVE